MIDILNLIRQERIKLEVEIRRSKRYRRQHLPIRYVLSDRQWKLGYNRFRKDFSFHSWIKAPDYVNP